MTATVLSGRDPVTGRTLNVSITGGRIAAIATGDETEAAWIAPGLVDLQVNGYGGHDFNSDGLTPGAVAAVFAALRDRGTTTFLPTLITAAEETIADRARTIQAARDADPVLADAIPCIHVEGPHLSPRDGPRGAHPATHIRPPDLAEFDRWQAACGNLIGMVTLSPHDPGAPDYIRGLVDRRVQVAIGHTDATPKQISAAVDAGATLSTHLGNGAAATLPRHPNFIWTQLADDRLTATFIADGHHLPADVLKAMIRAKGLDRAVLVSDVAAPGGQPPGLYDQPIGGRVELSADGRLAMAGTPYLAGAAVPLSVGIATAVRDAGVSLADALRMATDNPGRFVGNRGIMTVGAPADLIRFTWHPGATDLDIDMVLVGGREVS
ncbi:MAG: amidohydrolase family protein [Hyphomicrobiales bacterium]|nr:amidohydrolase family protein [Hyphomicrobiales bacterium]